MTVQLTVCWAANAANIGVTISMLQFNTAFLFKAIFIVALGFLPVAVNKESGFVWTAFFLPFSLACLAATLVESRQFECIFRKLSDSVIQIYTVGGRYGQWLRKCRIVATGFCLSVAMGFPLAHIVEPGLPELWVPIVAFFAVGAVALVGCSSRRTLLIEKRQFVTDYLLFGMLWCRRRWQVRDGDFLALFTLDEEQPCYYMLFVYREHRRHLIACAFTNEQIPAMEKAAHRLAELVDVTYDGFIGSSASDHLTRSMPG